MDNKTVLAEKEKLIVKDVVDETANSMVAVGTGQKEDGAASAKAGNAEPVTKPRPSISGKREPERKGIARQIEDNIPFDGQWSVIDENEDMLANFKIMPMWVPLAVAVAIWASLAALFSLKELMTIVIITAVALGIGGLLLNVRGKQKKRRKAIELANAPVLRQEELAGVLDADREKLLELKKEIKNPSIVSSVDSIQMTMKKLADNLEANPSEKTQIRKVVVHYVPMMLDLVKRYIKLEKQEASGTNINTSMASIESGLKKVDASFKDYLDGMFADDRLDIETDITVMQQLLTKEKGEVNKLNFDDLIDK